MKFLIVSALALLVSPVPAAVGGATPVPFEQAERQFAADPRYHNKPVRQKFERTADGANWSMLGMRLAADPVWTVEWLNVRKDACGVGFKRDGEEWSVGYEPRTFEHVWFAAAHNDAFRRAFPREEDLIRGHPHALSVVDAAADLTRDDLAAASRGGGGDYVSTAVRLSAMKLDSREVGDYRLESPTAVAHVRLRWDKTNSKWSAWGLVFDTAGDVRGSLTVYLSNAVEPQRDDFAPKAIDLFARVSFPVEDDARKPAAKKP